MLRREGIDFKLKFINLIELNENKINAICETANIDKENLYKINYLITNENGEVINNTQNFSLFEEVEKIKNFIKGFKVINNKEDLSNFITNANEESVNILALENNRSLKGKNNDNNNNNDYDVNSNFGIFFLENFFKEIILEKNFNFDYKEKVFNLLRYKNKSNNINNSFTYNIGNNNNNDYDFNKNNFDIKDNEILVFLNKDFYNINKKFLEFYTSLDLNKKFDPNISKDIDLNSNKLEGSIIIKIDENLSISLEKYFPKFNKICGFNYIISEKEKESFYESPYFKYMLLNENDISINDNDNDNNYENNNNNDNNNFQEENYFNNNNNNINTKAFDLINKNINENKHIEGNFNNNNKFNLDKDYKIVLRFINTNTSKINNETNYNNNINENNETNKQKEKDSTKKILQNFLKDLILITNNNNNNNYISNNNNISLTKTEINKINTLKKIIKKSIFTNNIPIAVQNKINLYNNKESLLIIYLNKYNIKSNPNLDYNKIKKNLLEIINGTNNKENNIEENQSLNKLFPNKNFLITSNQNIFSLFNFLNSEKENISIRHLDYSKYIKYNDDLSGNYSIFQIKDDNDLFEKIKNFNKNLIFNYKANFADFKEELNLENLKEFLLLSEKNKLNSYLENFDILTNENNNNNNEYFSIRNLNSQNYKENILKLNKNNYKYILLINNECIGCKKIESIIDDVINKQINNSFNSDLDSDSDSDSYLSYKNNNNNIKDIKNIEVYRYNTLNENYCFKKFRNVPGFLIMRNGAIEKEIDLREIIKNNEDHDGALRDFFQKNLK
jgi:hypothetical protein